MMRPCRRRALLRTAVALVVAACHAVAPAQPETAPLDMPAASLVAWGRCPPLPLGPHIVLADGGVIAGTLTAFDGKTAMVRSAALGTIPLPAADFVGFRATAASRPAETEIEEGMAAHADTQARWFIGLRNGDRLSARSLRLHDGLLSIDWQGRPVAVPIERVQSITTSTPTAPQPSATISVALDDGSRFSLSSIGEAAAVIAADPSLVVAVEGQAATSLARIRPTAIAPQDSIGGRRFAMGSTLAGDWPTIRGLTGFQGMAIGASGGPTRILYDVSRPARRLESTVAIDDSAEQGIRAIVRVVAIAADGVRKETFASPVLHKDGPPLFIRTDLEGATQIELVVEPVDGAASHAPTVWLDPRVIPVK
ncbi:MAG: NPCBM/NEW2 domain-containing protein [Planctomycetia bacterium]|jgi:hypothetical protein